jgi:hypothetical protein
MFLHVFRIIQIKKNIIMKKKWILLLIILFPGMIASEISAQGLIIQMNDGIENTVPLNTLQKLNFSQTDLLVVFKTGLNDAYGLSDIRKLYFDATVSTGEDMPLDIQHLSVYPNPAGDLITVKGIPDQAGTVSVYQTDGQLVLTETVTSGTVNIDISGLKCGLYLVNSLGRTTKFIKR